MLLNVICCTYITFITSGSDNCIALPPLPIMQGVEFSCKLTQVPFGFILSLTYQTQNIKFIHVAIKAHSVICICLASVSCHLSSIKYCQSLPMYHHLRTQPHTIFGPSPFFVVCGCLDEAKGGRPAVRPRHMFSIPPFRPPFSSFGLFLSFHLPSPFLSFFISLYVHLITHQTLCLSSKSVACLWHNSQLKLSSGVCQIHHRRPLPTFYVTQLPTMYFLCTRTRTIYCQNRTYFCTCSTALFYHRIKERTVW